MGGLAIEFSGVRCSVRWLTGSQIPEAALPVRDLPMGAAGHAAPDHPIILGDAGVDGAPVALAAFEARRAGRLVRPIEVGGVGQDGGEEVGELAGRASLRGDGAPGVEVVDEVYDVHGGCVCDSASDSTGNPGVDAAPTPPGKLRAMAMIGCWLKWPGVVPSARGLRRLRRDAQRKQTLPP